MRKIPVGVLLYVDGLSKVDFSCPDCPKSYVGVVIGGTDTPKECECGCLFDWEGLISGIICRKPRYCEICLYWHDEVCCNTDSEKIADFTNKDFSCNCHEFKGSESNA